MSTLFSNNNAEGGFRLRYLEIFNWGTFHGKIHRLQPDGQTSLLTGANGSGKTTLVDAILTLLVPGNKRFYNQSSGAEAKRDRDENSYFWGHYGRTFSDQDEQAATEKLRQKSDNPYSVLLAYFQNSATQHTVALVQVRWHSNGALRKVFIVAPYPLNIHDHFGAGKFDLRGEWRRRLLKQFPKIELSESFKEYAAKFSELFGLKEKALSLFNQTVGIKVLGELTQFVRQHMLEEPDAEEQFKLLYGHYMDLLISHKAIQKDEKQLELLAPVMEHKQLLAAAENALSAARFVQQQLPYFLDSVECTVLQEHIAALESALEERREEELLLSSQVKQLQQEKSQLITQKAALNIDTQIQLLEKDKGAEIKERDRKRNEFDNYTKLAGKLGLLTDINEASFRQNAAAIGALSVSLEQQRSDLQQEAFVFKNDMQRLSSEAGRLQEEIDSLLARKNRMPRELAAVREKLLVLLDTGENELPFAGELIRVLPDALHWEDAIEKVLNSFAMQLLVPEKYSREVNLYVHANNLRTKLVYQRIERRFDTLLRWPAENDSMLNKLDIKDAGHFSKWVELQLVERFNYYCTDDLDVFGGSQKALTSNGLIRNHQRHEKDDRPNRWNKNDYRLGWDNRDTVQWLMQEKARTEKEYQVIAKKLQPIEPLLKEIKQKQDFVVLISGASSFTQINWQVHAEKIASMDAQIRTLTTSSDKYQAICRELEKTTGLLDTKESALKTVNRKIGNQETEITNHNRRLLALRIDELTEAGRLAVQGFLGETGGMQAIWTGMDDFRIKATAKARAAEQDAVSKLSDIKLRTGAYISAFVNPGHKIIQEFADWGGDVMNISPDLGSLGELEDLYHTIRNQRLVENKRRFKDYMDKSMLDALTNYRTWLHTEEDKIKDVIVELNTPLRKITFNRNPDTYLQLECRAAKDPQVKHFKEQLSATIPNTLDFATQKDDAYRLEVFKNIQGLIQELQKEEAWRKKVTDIRNWLLFSAREYTLADNKATQYHDNTASYSGGQKAQFTYAILGAAIAHQFGIFQPGRQYKSLRFITVDEAFSKLDPEKSEFLMAFCEQLNLQLLVVTPLDKINIAEPFIRAVHFVEIRNKQHSMLYNMTMDEYRERKEEFKQLAVTAE